MAKLRGYDVSRVVAIIQARMSSSRLPGKVLLPLAGRPVLQHVVDRLGACRLVDAVGVATSTDPSDDPIQNFCAAKDVACFRGSLDDVLSRYVGAARAWDADYVVRITADCPALDPKVVDAVVAGALAGDYDCYGLDGEFPDGLDCTVFSASALERAAREAVLPSDREHVGPFIIARPGRFKTAGLELFKGLSDQRWTLDEPRDYTFLTRVFERLYDPVAASTGQHFRTADVVELLAREPGLSALNSGIERNEGYRKSLEAESGLATAVPLGSGQALYIKAKRLIPGGTQLLSKRPEMFAPDVWPAYYSRAKGSRVWDLDGREYIDMSIMAVGACILGYADDDVDAAVKQAIGRGVNSSLNCPEEVELAEALINLHPWFDMVRYARSGGEAMAMAVRIARARTGRDTVLFSGYHGWSDWYLAANLSDDAALDGQLMPGLEPKGVPRGLSGSALPFNVGDVESLRAAVAGREGEIAAIVIEPARGHEAPVEHLQALRDAASELGAVLIFDEITSGFRMGAGGIHRRYGVHPDMAVFAKSMANGYAMAAVIGTEGVMQAAQSTFISSTNWTERIGPVAALATLRKYEAAGAAEHIIAAGTRCKTIWREAAARAGLDLSTSGLPSLAGFSLGGPNGQAMATRFVIEMLGRGFLGFRQFKASLAHSAADLDGYSTAVDEAFSVLASTSPDQLLNTPVAHSGFHRLTAE
ncbi:MAG: glutamate-1-semialdehyde 2,1-aminomutase [Rhodothermales bacterium]